MGHGLPNAILCQGMPGKTHQGQPDGNPRCGDNQKAQTGTTAQPSQGLPNAILGPRNTQEAPPGTADPGSTERNPWSRDNQEAPPGTTRPQFTKRQSVCGHTRDVPPGITSSGPALNRVWAQPGDNQRWMLGGSSRDKHTRLY